MWFHYNINEGGKVIPGQGYCLCRVCTGSPSVRSLHFVFMSVLVSSHIPEMYMLGELMCLNHPSVSVDVGGSTHRVREKPWD